MTLILLIEFLVILKVGLSDEQGEDLELWAYMTLGIACFQCFALSEWDI